MNLCYSIVLLVLACWLPAMALAEVSRLASDTLHSRALEGNLLGDSADRSVLVYVPPSYDSKPTKRYPVVYLLHGNGGRNTIWVEGRYQGLNIKSAMDALIAAGTIREMILVMPDAYNRYLGSHYANSAVTGRWADFVCQDLVAHIDANYRTMSSPDSRGLAGHSMGGRGTLYLGMKCPGVFSAIYGLSSGRMAFEQFAPFDNETWRQTLALRDAAKVERRFFSTLGFAVAFSPNPDRPPFLADFPFEIVQQELKRVDAVWQKWLAHDPVALVALHQAALRQLRAIRFDCGTSDAMLGPNRKFAEALTAARIPHQFEEFDGDHTNRLRERLETRVLPFFSEMLLSK